MANSFIHAQSSVRKFGGKIEDYQPLHDFMDSSKATYADIRHRAILHNSFGIFLGERIFGHAIKNSDGKDVPVRVILEQHVIEDCGFIPTVEDWVEGIPLKDFMIKNAKSIPRDDVVTLIPVREEVKSV